MLQANPEHRPTTADLRLHPYVQEHLAKFEEQIAGALHTIEQRWGSGNAVAGSIARTLRLTAHARPCLVRTFIVFVFPSLSLRLQTRKQGQVRPFPGRLAGRDAATKGKSKGSKHAA